MEGHGVTKNQILQLLRRRGEAAVAELCQELGITATGVRQHLTELQAEGLVESRAVRGGPGRPRHRYRLSRRADQGFPTGDDQFSRDLLDLIAELEGTGQLDEVLGRTMERLVSGVGKQLTAQDLRRRLDQLVAALNERGYMAEAQELPDGRLGLLLHNCVIRQLAGGFPQICGHEAQAYSKAFGANVVMESSMAAGQGTCRYVLLPELEGEPLAMYQPPAE
ncbi:MAG: ArsR family transcriptional regulator [Deinococcus sp.]|nr:ArsR family transcriptional regulator [Deinococcus sp.]